MKRFLKWMLRIVIALVVLVVLALIFKDTILRIIVERRIREETGMEVHIGKFSSGLIRPWVTIRDLKLYNTAEYGGGVFLDVPELHLEADRAALGDGKVRVDLMRLNLAEISVVISEAGKTNIMALLEKSPMKRLKKRGIRIRGKRYQFESISTLELSVGKGHFIDLRNPRRNRDAVIDMENETFQDVREEGDIYGIIIFMWLRSGGTFGITTPPDVSLGTSNGVIQPITSNTVNSSTGILEKTVAP